MSSQREPNFMQVLTYGLSPIEFAVLSVQIPVSYEVVCCDDCFADLLALQSSCIVINPAVLTEEQFHAFHACYEDEERVLFLITQESERKFSFAVHIIDLRVRYDRTLRKAIAMLKDAEFSCISYCKNVKWNGGFVAIDIETTGIDPAVNEIIFLSAVHIVNSEVTERFESFVKPCYPISDSIEKLTGITNEMVASAPTLQEVMERFSTWHAEEPLVMYNEEFDLKFLKSAYFKTGRKLEMRGYIDILYLAWKLYASQLFGNRRTLDRMVKMLLGEEELSEKDVDIVADLFLFLIKKLHEEYEIHELSQITRLYDGIEKFLD